MANDKFDWEKILAATELTVGAIGTISKAVSSQTNKKPAYDKTDRYDDIDSTKINNSKIDLYQRLIGTLGGAMDININNENNLEHDEFDNNEEDDSFEVIDNSEISYSDKPLYLRLNVKRDRFEENKYRLDISKRTLEKEYPNLFKGNSLDNSLEYIMKKIFTEGLLMKSYITNLTFTNQSGFENRILSLRPAKEGVFLTEALPNGVTLVFKGHVYAGVFIIDEIHTTSDSGYRDFEVEVNVIPFHTNNPKGKKDDFLGDIIDNAASLTEYTEERLIEWEEYLKWRKEIARRQIVGCKYYKLTFDYKNRCLIFWLVCEGEEEFNKFKKYLRRDVQAFSDSYSQSEWHFKLRDDENKRNYRDKSVELGRYKKIIEQYYLHENDPSEQSNNNLDEKYAAYDSEKYEEDNDEDKEQSHGEIITKHIQREFDNPYIVKVAFELNREDADEILEKNYDNDEVENYIREEVLSDYFSEGFLALSAVGDFALISRLERAIDQLKRDENYSPNLSLWLFDIERAKSPSKSDNIMVSSWLNKGIESNEDQKQAVIKMLNAPDLCLIQGPPGTGKTTVIAEAIYQFVRNGSRVLIASQSNDAVDNALERLADNSAIRAIRLGQKSRKRKNKDDSIIKKFAEENALDYFYSSLSNQLSTQWLDMWNEMDNLRTQYQRDTRDTRLFVEDISDIQQYINLKNTELQSLSNEKNMREYEIKKAEEINKNLNNERRQSAIFVEFLEIGESAKFILSISLLNIIFNAMNPILQKFETYGIILSPLKLEVNKSSDITILNENLLLTINYFKCLMGVEMKIKRNKSVDTSQNNELSILEHKKVILQDEMDKLDEIAAEDEEYEQVHDERRKVIKQINELKKGANIISLTGTEKQIFSRKLTERIENQGNVSVGHLSNLFVDIKPIIVEFLELLSDLEKHLHTYNQNNTLKDISIYENEIEILNVKINNCKVLLEEKRFSVSQKQSSLITLAQKYNIDFTDSSEQVVGSIKKLNEENENKIAKNADFRRQWEGLLLGFKSRLNDKDSMKYDKEYYQDIYVNACNVVGISCTDNMRALTDKGYNEFDVVIIDEVSKATPPELLIPLMKGRKAVLVGDHRQLPPLFNEHEKSYIEIINSLEETDEEVRDLMTKENFNKYKNMVTSSLFKSYFEKADELIKQPLFTQYRMHSDIMNIINRFYDGHLNSGFTQQQEDEIKNHRLIIRGVDGSKFIVPDNHAYWIDSSRLPDERKFYESRPEGSTSTENILECYIIIGLLKKIAIAYSKEGFNKSNSKKIGVISFYQIQVNRLRKMIKKEKNNFDFSSVEIDINTVDRFQGKEKEIIITSLVRNTKTSKRREDSHIAAFERINVAFSRAQKMLVIVGAKDMYADQPVKLPNMNAVGEKTVYVYRNIIEELNRKSCYFGSGKIVNEQDAKEIDNIMTKEYGGKQ